MLGLVAEEAPKKASPGGLGDVVESAGEGEALRREDVPSEGDLQRYFSANEGPRRRAGRGVWCSSALAIRRNCSSLMARRSKLSKVDMLCGVWMAGVVSVLVM